MSIEIDGKIFKNLRFADDIYTNLRSPEELQTMLEQLNAESKSIDLEMNLSKTQLMFNNQ